MWTSQWSNADSTIPSPVLGEREVCRLEGTVADPTGSGEGHMRRDVRRSYAVHSSGLLAGEVGLEISREHFTHRAAQGEFVDTLADGKSAERMV